MGSLELHSPVSVRGGVVVCTVGWIIGIETNEGQLKYDFRGYFLCHTNTSTYSYVLDMEHC